MSPATPESASHAQPRAATPEVAVGFDFGLRLKLPVHLVDERYSSIEAEAALLQRRRAGERGRYDRSAIDSAAATVILERWLDGSARPETTLQDNL